MMISVILCSGRPWTGWPFLRRCARAIMADGVPAGLATLRLLFQSPQETFAILTPRGGTQRHGSVSVSAWLGVSAPASWPVRRINCTTAFFAAEAIGAPVPCGLATAWSQADWLVPATLAAIFSRLAVEGGSHALWSRT
mmetsp:Transcript_92016/g.168758  ORF Transcript_92016/g.168758 Transcript_92016/m.168758 type:complete len:139 (+) Transcript_92016:1-417(+)